MTQRKTIRIITYRYVYERYVSINEYDRFHVCVRGIVLLTTLRDASKKQAEKRALDVEEEQRRDQV